ncbi:MAG TPA: glucans biosynthesis glucosyltransferase MdoH [Burkholderiaceae bacterium]|nr:glucans biosynthesis glucosyltransferase MdoH [Burkholderiaceae bacterium]
MDALERQAGTVRAVTTDERLEPEEPTPPEPTVEHRFPSLPPEAPLSMPVQSLRATTERARRIESDDAPRSMALRRLTLLAATALLTAFAAREMYLVLQVAGLTFPEQFVLLLFVALFAWIAFSFVTNLVGFVSTLAARSAPPPSPVIDDEAPSEPPTRTALLFPVYNEEIAQVMARLLAMHESLAETGALRHFDFFVLSDTTRPGIRLAEEAAFLEARERTGGHRRIFYRHRRYNEGRKAGNIGDWVRRFGAAYEHMVVLDADSLMSGDTLLRLAAEMDRRPRAGLIQTLPVIVNASTTFARLQQFANRLYGPILVRGLAWWHGTESNYWGHNAIIRTRAFAEQAGLPVLAGRKPIGGEIMSHDFVEAALMRRGGWSVEIAPGLGGSYEESPPALSDHAVRDRRWCQGNLQHAGVLPARGLHPISRLHLLTGIGAYLTAPLWLLFLIVGILIALQAQYIRPEYFPRDFALFPRWPAQDPVRAAWVFVGTMSLLFVPKLLALFAMLVDAGRRRGFGGTLRSFAGTLLETLVSGLMAPVTMLDQSVTVLATLSGRDVGWNVQRRDDGALPWTQVARHYAGHTLFGVLLGIAAYAVSWSLFLWMSPVILGLLLAIPLAALTADARLGRGLRRLGLLLVPEESAPPPILVRANALAAELESALPAGDAIALLATCPELVAAHAEMIEARPRRRGEIDTELVIGLARLDEIETPQELREMLSVRELSALLADRRGFERLVSVVRQADAGPNEADARHH